MSDVDHMREAIEAAREGIRKGQTPFGAVVVKDGRVVSRTHNTVWAHTDVTAHAEVNAIREACKTLKTIDLSGSTIYSTTEPCPMCFTAIHWANISRIVYGAEIKDARAAGFNELTISNETMKAEGGSGVEITAGILREECRQLLREWAAKENKKTY